MPETIISDTDCIRLGMATDQSNIPDVQKHAIAARVEGFEADEQREIDLETNIIDRFDLECSLSFPFHCSFRFLSQCNQFPCDFSTSRGIGHYPPSSPSTARFNGLRRQTTPDAFNRQPKSHRESRILLISSLISHLFTYNVYFANKELQIMCWLVDLIAKL
jgi:hypothetical protein